MQATIKRREWLQISVLELALPASTRALAAAMQSGMQSGVHSALQAFAQGAVWREGRVSLDIAPLVENGNTVPVVVTVQSPMTGNDRVRAIALFTERNPQPEVAVFHLGAHVARAEVATRMRLAHTQQVWALARMADGSCWATRAEVVVTLAACIEGE